MWRGVKLRHCEQRSANRLASALSALLFALSILAQFTMSAGAAASEYHWLCAKPIAKISAAADGADPADGRTSAGLVHCDHCTIGMAPTLPGAVSDGHVERRPEPRADSHSNWTDPGGREPLNPSLARAPPAFS